ncbi:hypothetical protein [Pseudonocardia endophytica]|uniref:Uncharacterized protein n=1 Tax=Pseudonocardia endophytica TaxID=401976 RepID=A0A4R1HU22_PSEEN|nr:hypothetical protein [Pseudonocardia endophytica]TCK24425.1 hypothetical protein EV378_0197 [Pseudonocardia endophytica]
MRFGNQEDTVQLPAAFGVTDEDPRIADARRRWRAAGDRLWPIALSDGASYELAAQAVGEIVDALREHAGSLEELVALEAAPSALLSGLGATGERAVVQPELLAAACSLRGDELAAARARWRRAERIAAARADGLTWVEVDRSATRVAEMHLATGTTIVATADPYLGDEPFRISEMVLDTVSGEPLAGPDGVDTAFATTAEWEADRERRRREISERLDTRDRDGSDS